MEPGRIAQRVAKKVLASSIDIDTGQVRDLIRDLLEKARDKLRDKDPGDEIGEGELSRTRFYLNDVTGRSRKIRIRLVGDERRDVEAVYKPDVPFINAELVNLYVPSDWKKNLLDPTDPMPDMAPSLAHELTHVKDYISESEEETYKYLNEKDLSDWNEEDWDTYHNVPTEVNAYISHIVQEVQSDIRLKKMVLDDVNKIIRLVTRQSSTWKRIKEHLSEENKRKVLREVYNRLKEQMDG